MPRPVSVEKYLHTSYEPEAEFVDGVIERRNAGEMSHSEPLSATMLYLHENRACWGIEVLPILRVRVSATRYRVPDICVFLGDPHEDIPTTPPFLCIEILSPKDRADRFLRKIDDYLKFGVQYIWVIDPAERAAYFYTPNGMRTVEDGVLRTSDPDIAVPLAEVFGL